MTTGDTIGADIKAAEPIITAFLTTLAPGIAQGIGLGLKLLAVAEPAVYNAVAAAIQGTELTPDQTQAKDDAIVRLNTPEQYFQ
jgi:hypothetical protein